MSGTPIRYYAFDWTVDTAMELPALVLGRIDFIEKMVRPMQDGQAEVGDVDRSHNLSYAAAASLTRKTSLCSV